MVAETHEGVTQMETLLKPYLLPVKAVRITKKNWKALRELASDDVLDATFNNKEDLIGEWFVLMDNGSSVWPSHTQFIPDDGTLHARIAKLEAALRIIAGSVEFVLDCKQCPKKMSGGLQGIVDVAMDALAPAAEQKED
jgi:hypothetical protein